MVLTVLECRRRPSFHNDEVEFSLNVHTREKTTFKFSNAHVLGATSSHLLTSPTMDFLPSFFPAVHCAHVLMANSHLRTTLHTPRCTSSDIPGSRVLRALLKSRQRCTATNPLSHWEVVPAHVLTGQGCIAEAPWLHLDWVVNTIAHAAASAQYLRSPVNFNPTRTAMLDALKRLRFLPMARSDSVLQHAQCQQMALDVDVMTKFLLTFAPHIRQKSLRYDVDKSLTGCFTNNPTVAEILQCSGIPFWLIRDIQDVPVGSIDVLEVTHAFYKAFYVNGTEYFDELHPPPVYTPFKTIGVYSHQIECIKSRALCLASLMRHRWMQTSPK